MSATEKILILSRRPLMVNSIQKTLRNHETLNASHIETYEDLKEALSEVSISAFEFVLLDAVSLNDSLFEALIQFRALNQYIPIIIINSPGQEKIAIRCLKHGANYYLIEDQNWQNELMSVIDAVIDESQHKNQLKFLVNQLKQENQKLKKETILDSETAFYTKQYFEGALSRELERASRHSLELACLVLDIAEAPKDTKHQSLLDQMTLLLKSLVRSSDIWAKLSPTRFAALLPHTSPRQARHAIKRINSEIKGIKQANDLLVAKWGMASFNKNKIKNQTDLLNAALSSLKERA